MFKDTLILNSSYMPLNTVTFEKAYKMWVKSLLCEEYVVDVVSEYDNVTVTVYGEKVKAPAILRIAHNQSINPNKKLYKTFNRINVWTRDNAECQYCGKKVSLKEMHWDHVIPRASGGKTVWNNIVCCCKKCNTKKADMKLSECGLKLKKKPTLPSDCTLYRSLQNKMKHGNVSLPHESWKDYL